MKEFIGREEELREMKETLSRPQGSVTAIYGRRRVGKSELIRQALKEENCRKIAFVALEKAGYQRNLDLLTEILRKSFHEDYLSFHSLTSLLNYLYSKSTHEKIILVLDEYPYFLADHPEANSELQTSIDGDHKDANLHLVLSGSSFGAMKDLMEGPSPLHGRFNAILHLQPFDYFDAAKFCPNLAAEDKFRYYSIFGGIPYYLDNLDFSLSLEENVKRKLLPIGSLFENEISNISLKEIRKEEVFQRTLSLIAGGKHSFVDINKALTGEGSNKATYPLKKLREEKAVERLSPINMPSEKKSSYYLTDPLLQFYFAFLENHVSERTYYPVDAFWEEILPSLEDNYFPHRFEKVAQEYLIRRNKMGLNHPLFSDIGHFAFYDKKGKENLEFDVVTESKDGYRDYECKYLEGSVTRVMVEKEIADASRRKIPFVGFGFFSRNSFEEGIPDEVEKYSLEDLYQLEEK